MGDTYQVVADRFARAFSEAEETQRLVRRAEEAHAQAVQRRDEAGAALNAFVNQGVVVAVDSVGCAKPLGILDMLTQMDKELARVSAAIVDLETALSPLSTTAVESSLGGTTVGVGRPTGGVLTELGYQTRRVSEFADQIVAMRSRLLL